MQIEGDYSEDSFGQCFVGKCLLFVGLMPKQLTYKDKVIWMMSECGNDFYGYKI